MKVLFDANRFTEAETMPPVSESEAAALFNYLENAVRRVDKAIRAHIVWAKVYGLSGSKYPVKDVRILDEEIADYKSQVAEQPAAGLAIVVYSERLQVLLLEGWRTAQLVWTDEEMVDEIEGVQ